MKRSTKTVRIKTIFLMIILIAAPTLAIITGTGTDAAALRCVLDQEMWAVGGSDGFGGATILGQTFVPSAPGHVCKVVVRIQKNNPLAGALTLRIRRHDKTPLPGGTITIPAAAIPMGLSVQSFNFACVPLLAGSPFYGLTLEAPTSPPAAYRWFNSAGAGGAGAYPAGHGWFSLNGGAFWMLRPYDYAFRVYQCRP